MNDPETNNDAAAADEIAAATDAVLREAGNGHHDEAAALREELAAANDRALRAQAELDNYRKRARKELEDGRRYAQLPLLSDLLPVVDNVRRAIQATEKQPGADVFLAGFKMVAEQLEGVLARHHCQRIEALYQPFDPHFHAAVMLQPSSEYPANTAVQVMQEGYQLHDRVIRPAQVIVSSAADTAEK